MQRKDGTENRSSVESLLRNDLGKHGLENIKEHGSMCYCDPGKTKKVIEVEPMA